MANQSPVHPRPKGARTIPIFHTREQVAKRLLISQRSVDRMIKAGELRAHKIGGQVRISEEDFLAYVASTRA
jgi:excisionase family DNA binding protein